MTNPTLTIPRDVINPIIEAKVHEAIIEAMGGSKEILTAAISRILNTKVDKDGKVSSYARSDSDSWLGWAVGRAVRKAAQGAIEEAIGKHEKVIRDCLVREMQKKNSPMVRDLIRSMTDSIVQTAGNKYKLTVSIAE